MFSAGAGVFFAGAGGEKPGVCTALTFLILSQLSLTSKLLITPHYSPALNAEGFILW